MLRQRGFPFLWQYHGLAIYRSNMPGIVARTAMHGFVNVAAPYILQIAELGVDKAMEENPAIEVAVNTYHGEMRHLPRWNL